jgi:glycosyltransferase involved in cell wall biosynthesis
MKIFQKSESPLVTVGIPVYNDEKYVAIAIGDILAQTYQNIEIVISDNCSTDGTGDICWGYASKDARIRYVRQEYNLGPLGNFKYLLNRASGEYFMWAASDDRWHPDFISNLVESLEIDKSASVAFCNYYEIDEHGEIYPIEYCFDFGGESAVRRITKFHMISSTRRDAFFYGLYRTNKVINIEFKKWWWINKNIPMNLAYPLLSYILASGNYKLVKSDKKLWLNRVHLNSKPRHSGAILTWNILFSYSAFLIRKINQLYATERAVIKGAKSFSTGMLVFPVLAIRCLYDCSFELLQVFSRTLLSIKKRPRES